MRKKKISTIYDLFSDYSVEEVDNAISRLKVDTAKLVYKNYGGDLKNPKPVVLSKDFYDYFYSTVCASITILLIHPEYTMRKKRVKCTNDTSQTTISDDLHEENEFTKEHCMEILELLRKPIFIQFFKDYPTLEAIVILLRFGYVDGKYFSPEAIADFLGLSVEHVDSITNKALGTYEMNFTNGLDRIIEIGVGDKPIQYSKTHDKRELSN